MRQRFLRQPEPMIMDRAEQVTAYEGSGTRENSFMVLFPACSTPLHATLVIRRCRQVVDLRCGPTTRLVPIALLNPKTRCWRGACEKYIISTTSQASIICAPSSRTCMKRPCLPKVVQDYEHSLWVAFSVEEYRKLAYEELEHRLGVYQTFLALFMVIIKSADRPIDSRLRSCLKNCREKLSPPFLPDLDHLRRFFRFGGLADDLSINSA